MEMSHSKLVQTDCACVSVLKEHVHSAYAGRQQQQQQGPRTGVIEQQLGAALGTASEGLHYYGEKRAVQHLGLKRRIWTVQQLLQQAKEAVMS